MSGRTRVTIVGTAVLLTAANLHAAPPGDAPQTIPGWRLPQAALDALWNALAWLLILPS
jgi:hypothetical protein